MVFYQLNQLRILARVFLLALRDPPQMLYFIDYAWLRMNRIAWVGVEPTLQGL